MLGRRLNAQHLHRLFIVCHPIGLVSIGMSLFAAVPAPQAAQAVPAGGRPSTGVRPGCGYLSRDWTAGDGRAQRSDEDLRVDQDRGASDRRQPDVAQSYSDQQRSTQKHCR